MYVPSDFENTTGEKKLHNNSERSTRPVLYSEASCLEIYGIPWLYWADIVKRDVWSSESWMEDDSAGTHQVEEHDEDGIGSQQPGNHWSE